MGFLSYAQNFEDVMLWRALGHVANGLYVDIGAQHPRIDSISRAFYERGWRGVHIEPVPAFAELLRRDRPDEMVLQVALGDHEGTLELNVFADTGLSTAISSYAERHEVERGYVLERIRVPMLTVRSALDSLAGKQVHWLKIDVEGFEEQVLRGWDSQQLRPWIIVVEATIPNSTETEYEKWDPVVSAAGYRFVYFDGLNRFYIADEHSELAAAFSAPPNIFDAVEVSGQASWGLCNFAVAECQAQIKALAEQLEARGTELAGAAEYLRARDAELVNVTAQLHAHNRELANAATRALELERQLSTSSEQLATVSKKAEEQEHTSYYWWHTAEDLRQQVDALNGQFGRLVSSKSWRLTEPLRRLNVHAKGIRSVAGRAVRWTLRQSGRVKRKVTDQAAPVIAAADLLDVVVLSQASAPAAGRRLSPRAARLYKELKQVVEGETK